MKTELKSLILTGALCASTTTAPAQGTVRFDWVGNYSPNPIQASLTLDASLVYPNSVFWYGADEPDGDGPGVEVVGLTVTTPDHSWPQDGRLESHCNPLAGPSGFYSHIDASGQLNVFVLGYLPGAYAGNGNALEIVPGLYSHITEYDTSGREIYSSPGHWQETIVPEPSCAALLGLGLLGLYMKRAASRIG